eukprot:gene22012-28105_t
MKLARGFEPPKTPIANVKFDKICLGSKNEVVNGRQYLTIQKLLEKHDNTPISLFKMDIEGYEMEVFDSMLTPHIDNTGSTTVPPYSPSLPYQLLFETHWWQMSAITSLFHITLFQQLTLAGYRPVDRASGDTALHKACSNGNVEIVRLLLDAGANKNIQNKREETPLFFACRQSTATPIVDLLLKAGCSVRLPNADQRTPMHIACQNGCKDIVSLIISHGVELNVSDKNDFTPLHDAAFNGHTEIVKLLLAAGADETLLTKRRDEIFFRINKRQIYELFNEYEADEYESIAESGRSRDLRIVTHNQSDSPVYDKPYLILDVRDTEAFNACHLLQARSFPYTLLRRDQLHPEIYKFRNKPETLIIVYCDDEKISRDAGKVLVDRGTDNIYLLTGGMEEFSQEYPAFLEGIPPSPKSSPVKQHQSTSSRGGLSRIPENTRATHHSSGDGELTPNKLKRHNGECPPAASSRGLGGVGSLGGGGMTFARGGGGSSARSVSNMSMASTGSVAESIISRAASRKGKF